MTSGKEFTITHVVDEQGLDNAIGIEMVVLKNVEGKDVIHNKLPLEVVKHEGNLYTFKLTSTIDLAGSFKVAFRMFPKSDKMLHAQDFAYVRWF